MNEPHRYTMVIQWSVEDSAYVVLLPEWEDRVSNPVTHGDSYEEAVRNGVDAITALVASTLKGGEPLPHPEIRQASPSFA